MGKRSQHVIHRWIRRFFNLLLTESFSLSYRLITLTQLKMLPITQLLRTGLMLIATGVQELKILCEIRKASINRVGNRKSLDSHVNHKIR